MKSRVPSKQNMVKNTSDVLFMVNFLNGSESRGELTNHIYCEFNINFIVVFVRSLPIFSYTPPFIIQEEGMAHRQGQGCGDSQDEGLSLSPWEEETLPLEDFYNVTQGWGPEGEGSRMSQHHLIISCNVRKNARNRICLNCSHLYFPKHHENFEAVRYDFGCLSI